MTNVFFVNDTSSGFNWGSQATSRAFRDLISETDSTISDTSYKVTLRRQQENAQLLARTYLREGAENVLESARKLDIKGAYHGTRGLKDAVPREYSQFEAFADAAMRGNALEEEIAAIRRADIVLINGEGLVYSSSDRCTRAIFFLAYLSKRYLDTDCVMANLTLDTHDEQVAEMAENVLPLLDDVVFREPASAGIHSRYSRRSESGADPVFSYHPDVGREYLRTAHRRGVIDVRPYSTNDFDPAKEYICVAGSSIFATEGRLNVRGYYELCKRLKEVCPQILLVVSAQNDERLLAPVAEALDIDIVGLNISIRASLSLLSNANLYIGGRYHPAIFASKGGVPIVPFSANTHKIEGLLDMLDVETRIWDPFEIRNTVDDIAELAEYHLQDPSLFEHTRSKSKEIAERSRANVEYIQRSPVSV